VGELEGFGAMGLIFVMIGWLVYVVVLTALLVRQQVQRRHWLTCLVVAAIVVGSFLAGSVVATLRTPVMVLY